MPIYKLSSPTRAEFPAAEGRAVETHKSDSSRLSFAELPEADRYDKQSATKTHVDGGLSRPKADHSDEMKEDSRRESFIEREIREQRQREKELAAMRTLVMSGAFEQPTDGLVAAQASSASVETSKPPPLPDSPVPHSKPPPLPDSPIPHSAASHQHAVEPQVFDGLAAIDEDQLAEQKYVNPGEGLIVRELLEQQKREEELRLHWKEMGIELFGDHVDHDMYTEPELLSEQASPAGHHAKEHPKEHRAKEQQVEEQRSKELHSKASKVDVEMRREPSTSKEKDVLEETAQRRVAVTKVEIIDEVLPETPKYVKKVLLPLESSDDEDEQSSKKYVPYVPENETPLEREIKAAREREEALRHARGLPSTTDEEARRVSEVEIEIKSRSRSTGDRTDGAADGGSVAEKKTVTLRREPDDYHVVTKRFAESRMKVELQRERKRELDLRSSGVITTISEERIGELLKFVEVVPRETGDRKRDQKARMSADANLVMLRHKETELETTSPKVKDAAKEHHAAVPATVVKVEQKVEHKTEQKERPTATAAVVKVSSDQKKEKKEVFVHREMPAVLRTYSYPYSESESSVTADTLMTSTRISPEARIEEEVAEFKRREQELRLLRETLRRESLAKESATVEETGKRHHNEPDRHHGEPDKHHGERDKHHGEPNKHHGEPDRHDKKGEDDAAVKRDHVDLNSSADEHDDKPEARGRKSPEPEVPLTPGGRRRLALIAEWEKMIVTSQTSS